MDNKKHPIRAKDVSRALLSLIKDVVKLQDDLSSLLIISEINLKVQYRWKKYDLSKFQLPRKQTRWKKYDISNLEIPKVQYRWKKYDLSKFEPPPKQAFIDYPKLPENYIISDNTLYKHIREDVHENYSVYYGLIKDLIYSDKRKPYILISETMGEDEFISYVWESYYDFHENNIYNIYRHIDIAWQTFLSELIFEYRIDFEERFDRIERRYK